MNIVPILARARKLSASARLKLSNIAADMIAFALYTPAVRCLPQIYPGPSFIYLKLWQNTDPSRRRTIMYGNGRPINFRSCSLLSCFLPYRNTSDTCTFDLLGLVQPSIHWFNVPPLSLSFSLKLRSAPRISFKIILFESLHLHFEYFFTFFMNTIKFKSSRVKSEFCWVFTLHC